MEMLYSNWTGTFDPRLITAVINQTLIACGGVDLNIPLYFVRTSLIVS